MESAPTLKELRHAWERKLLAQVQLIELTNWDIATSNMVRATVSEYEALERAYVERMVAQRRERDEAGRER